MLAESNWVSLLHYTVGSCPSERGDEYFRTAAVMLIENNFHQSQYFFAKAYRKYRRSGNHLKMMECLLGSAIIEAAKGKFEKSLEVLVLVRKKYARCRKRNDEGLKKIKQTIHQIQLELGKQTMYRQAYSNAGDLIPNS